ncbi:MAG: tRNA (adenosine(37)-N6)-dimethylallyltransferase MiaA [Bacteroidales bacterium]|jgi:tRNA dimethylallyltransferase|nr:tRNA (adenosine(37)-N6)-dimethylallyltransferase MiaA [Bacteroidales bacterium]
MKKKLVVLIGPTAVGKTALSIELANFLNTEIVSADSRQFYKELNIGVATPSLEELSMAKHNLIGHISIQQKYNISDFEQDALKELERIFQENDYAVLTGGSGLYVNALCYGVDNMPDVKPEIREELNEIFTTQGIVPLQEELKLKDPEYWEIVDKQNHIRLIRALEVCRQTGKTFTSFRSGEKKQRDFEIIKIGLERSRENLLDRIYQRVDIMIKDGLIEEAKGVYPYRNLQALQTVGYKELFEYFDGKVDLPTAIENIKINTRQYAKRQMTWFKKDKSTLWLNAENKIDWKCLDL